MSYYNKTYSELNDLTRRFLLNEGEININTYVQAIGDILESLSPKTSADKNRVMTAKNHLREIRRLERRLREHVKILEERVQILEEGNDSEVIK